MTTELATAPAAGRTAGRPGAAGRRARNRSWVVTVLAMRAGAGDRRPDGGLLRPAGPHRPRLLLQLAGRLLHRRAGTPCATPTSPCSKGRSSIRTTPAPSATAFGPITNSIYTATPLICAGLAVALAFRAGLFNIGGNGQVIAGAFGSGYVGLIVVAAAGDPPGRWRSLAGIAGRCVLGLHRRLPQGPHRCARGHHDHHAQLRRHLRPALPAGQEVDRGAEQPAGQQVRSTAPPGCRTCSAANSRLDLGIVLALVAAAAGVLAADPQHHRLPAARGRREPGRGPDGRHERRLGDHAGDGRWPVGWPGWPARPWPSAAARPTRSPRTSPPTSASTRSPWPCSGRSKPWGVVWAGLLFGALRTGGAQMQAAHQRAGPGRHHHRDPGADRHLHRRAQADRGHLPA